MGIFNISYPVRITFLFLIFKELDLISSYLVFNKYGGGYDMEANPVMRALLQQYGLLGAVILILTVAVIFFFLARRYEESRAVRFGFFTFLALTAGVVLMNFAIYFLI